MVEDIPRAVAKQLVGAEGDEVELERLQDRAELGAGINSHPRMRLA